jgi:hypothetical protein
MLLLLRNIIKKKNGEFWSQIDSLQLNINIIKK